MTTSIKLGFMGSYKTDLILYISRIASLLGCNVAILDASKEGHIKYSIPDMQSKVVTYNGCDIYLNTEIEYSLYDFVLIDYGLGTSSSKELYKNNELIIVSDLQKYNVNQIEQTLVDSLVNVKEESLIKIKFRKIYRDLVRSKITSDYIDNIYDKNQYISNAEKYLFEIDEIDYRTRIESQYDDIFTFTKLSKSYNQLFFDIFNRYLDIEKKQILKAIKLARKGKIACK